MRAIATAFAAAAFALCFAAEAGAQGRSAQVGGTYAASFEEVANNCDRKGKTLATASIRVQQSDRKVSLSIPRIPILEGRLGRRGKLRADTGDRPSAEGRFSVSGRIERGELHMVLIAEYYDGDRPLCTQSWSVTGKKK